MLRLAFWLTALLLLPLGLGLYWLPQETADLLGASPLWLVRGAGALLTAWSLGLLYAGYRTDPTGRVNLVAGNLLMAATLGAAALRLDLPNDTVVLALAALLLTLGLAGLLIPGAAPLPAPAPHTEVVQHD